MTKKKSIETFADPPATLSGHPFYGVILDPEQEIFANAIWSDDNDIIFVDAKAGSGKTFVSTGVANLLVQYGKYSNIIYIMSPYGERKQGWLPGTITEKSSVYFEAFMQALTACNVNINTAINDESMVNQKTGDGYITCITDTFLRGTNLNDCVVIIDEAQNYTIPQLKKTLTRIGSNVKVIVVGHTLQCDLDRPEKSGFAAYMKHFAGKERCAICTLTQNHRGWISQWADEISDKTFYTVWRHSDNSKADIPLTAFE